MEEKTIIVELTVKQAGRVASALRKKFLEAISRGVKASRRGQDNTACFNARVAITRKQMIDKFVASAGLEPRETKLHFEKLIQALSVRRTELENNATSAGILGLKTGQESALNQLKEINETIESLEKERDQARCA